MSHARNHITPSVTAVFNYISGIIDSLNFTSAINKNYFLKTLKAFWILSNGLFLNLIN